MIALSFATGGNLRRVIINKRKVSLLAAELKWEPLEIDLDKLDNPTMQDKLKVINMEDNKQLLRELSNLTSEKEIAEDIVRDFQRTGWRLFKKTNGVN